MQRTEDVESQCTHVGQHGKCIYEVVPGTTKCLHHGGGAAEASNEKKAISSYRLQLFQARLDRHQEDVNIKDLRGEIGVLRMMIETKLNNCKDDYDLMLQSSSIAQMVVQANTLVTSCHRIETLTGQLLDKQSLAEFAKQVVEIISNECDPDTSDRIADQIITTLTSGAV